MSQKWKRFLLALVGGGLALRWATHPMGLKLALWQRAWGQRYGPAEGRKLAGRVRVRYDALRADCPYQPDRRLRSVLDDNILPGLALYRAISSDAVGQPAGEALSAGQGETGAAQHDPAAGQNLALQETERLFKAAAGPLLLPVRLLRLVPNPFPFFRWALKKLMAWGSPAPGWEFQLLEDSPQRLAFDAQRCFYLDTLCRYQAPELTALFCRIDDWLMAEMPAAIAWRRSGTLGRGDAVCDFDWCNQA